MAMEFLQGADLGNMVEKNGTLPIAQACDYIRQAALGLQHAHEKGLIHRDIKPANLFLAKTESGEIVKVLDFGLTLFEDDKERTTRLTHIGSVMGTIDFMAPEQAADASSADIRSDIYSLGCSLFHLLTRKVPFEGGSPIGRLYARMTQEPSSVKQLRPDVPATLDAVVTKMMAKEPADRYQAPAEVAVALRPFSKRGISRQIRALASLALVVACLAVGGMLLLHNSVAVNDSRRTDMGTQSNDSQRKTTPAQLIVGTWRKYVIEKGGSRVFAGLITFQENGLVIENEMQTGKWAPINSGIRFTVSIDQYGHVDLKPNSEVMCVGTNTQRNGDRWDWELIRCEITNTIGMRLVLIPAGKFLMGSPASEPGRFEHEGPQHDVEISQFYMGVYEVTQRQFQAVMGFNPSEFNEKNGGGPDHPVEVITWHEAATFCKKLTELENRSGRSYRLPTEAEWEYACTAGTRTPFSFGTDMMLLDEYAWNVGNSGKRTHIVGTKKPNQLGLFDMHGNVWEYCADWYSPTYYKESPKQNPQGADRGTTRVIRGGCWLDPKSDAATSLFRSRFRGGWHPPDRRAANLGFRVVMTPAN